MSRPVQLFLLLLATALAIYWPGLSGPLVFDDHQNLAPLKDWVASNTSAWRVIFDNASGLLGRQVSMASLVLNVQLLGPDIWGLKLGNLIIHLTNGSLVYVFLASLARVQPPTHSTPDAALRWMPCIVAGIWLLHPLQVSTTLYVIQRMAMLSAMFTLGTLILYIAARDAVRVGRRTRAYALFVLAGISTLLAAFSKENGVLAPALCALIEFWVFTPALGRRRHAASWAFIVCTLVLPALGGIVLSLSQAPFIMAEYANRPFTMEERLLTQGRVLWDYVGALVLPYGPRLGLYHDDYLVSTGWLSPPTSLIAWLGWLAVLGVAWRLRERLPALGLGVGFYLGAQALESSVFPLLMYFEHRAYLPSVGALWAIAGMVAFGAQELSKRMDHPQRVFPLAIAALLATLSVATYARAYVWQSQHTLLVQGLEHHPHSRWLRTDVAQELMQRSPPDMEGARSQMDVLASSPQDSTRRLAGVWQLMIDCSAGKKAHPESKALAFEGIPTDIEADLLLAFEALGNGVLQRPCTDLGPNELGIAMAGVADRARIPQTHFNLRRMRFKAAQLVLKGGDAEAALLLLQIADSGTREDAPIGAFLADILIAHGRSAEAKPILMRLKRQIPEDDPAGQAILRGLEERLATSTRR